MHHVESNKSSKAACSMLTKKMALTWVAPGGHDLLKHNRKLCTLTIYEACI